MIGQNYVWRLKVHKMDLHKLELTPDVEPDVCPDIEPDVCPVTKLSKREKEVLTESWQRMFNLPEKENKTFGMHLLFWLLENVPNMRSRLAAKIPKNMAQSGLIANEMFIEHSQALIQTLDDFVSLLDNPKRLDERMREMAKLHLYKRPSVGMQYFSKIESNFDKFIISVLQVDSKDDIVRVWSKFISCFVHVVAEEEELYSNKAIFTCCVIQ